MIIKHSPWSDTPEVTAADRERLLPILATANTLIKGLAKNDLTPCDIKRMILLEYLGVRAFPRKYVLDRLFSRLAKMYTAYARHQLDKCLW